MELQIGEIQGYEVLDSRGNPTVQVEVVLLDGSTRHGHRAVRGLHRGARGPRAAGRRRRRATGARAC